jgi:Zn-dependent metalloprotease
MTMAKAATAKSVSGDKKKKKAAPAATAKIKAKKANKSAKSHKKAERKSEPNRRGKSARSEGFEGLAKLVDHPLVADLLAAGAIAAVAAIAEHQSGKGKGQTSSRMVKSVGKAAAAAMGKKLFGDLGAIAGAATDAAKKA